MKRKTRKVLIIAAAILLLPVLAIGGFNIYFAVIGGQKQSGSAQGYAWSAEDAYGTQKTETLDMGTDSFKILVLTDIHLKNHGTFGAWFGVNYVIDRIGAAALDRLVEKTAPDMIVVLGDSVLTKRNDIETKRLVKQMDSYKIPWAPVFGNHDDEGRADKARLAEIYAESEFGLFEYGPENLHGAGNYVLELKRGGASQYALFFFDSGSSLEFEAKTDGINAEQVRFYEWNMEALRSKIGSYPKNMAFFHIPLPVYQELNSFLLGKKGEPTCAANADAGLLDSVAKSNGTHIFVGHDHANNFIADFQGVKLGYAMKSSYNCYIKSGMTGGTLLTIDSQNNVKEELKYF